MALRNIHLASISSSNRAEGKFYVTVYSDDGRKIADFDCDSEHDAIKLRNAVRDYALVTISEDGRPCDEAP